jgi:stalled ribosome rescue protein Dom34
VVYLLCVIAGSSIRLKGRNLTECEHIKLGAYHTLELEPQRAFSVAKACWDSLDIERLRSACDPQASADLAALLITVSAGYSAGSRLFLSLLPVCRPGNMW